jgi:hypothetical protein
MERGFAAPFRRVLFPVTSESHKRFAGARSVLPGGSLSVMVRVSASWGHSQADYSAPGKTRPGEESKSLFILSEWGRGDRVIYNCRSRETTIQEVYQQEVKLFEEWRNSSELYPFAPEALRRLPQTSGSNCGIEPGLNRTASSAQKFHFLLERIAHLRVPVYMRSSQWWPNILSTSPSMKWEANKTS